MAYGLALANSFSTCWPGTITSRLRRGGSCCSPRRSLKCLLRHDVTRVLLRRDNHRCGHGYRAVVAVVAAPPVSVADVPVPGTVAPDVSAVGDVGLSVVADVVAPVVCPPTRVVSSLRGSGPNLVASLGVGSASSVTTLLSQPTAPTVSRHNAASVRTRTGVSVAWRRGRRSMDDRFMVRYLALVWTKSAPMARRAFRVSKHNAAIG